MKARGHIGRLHLDQHSQWRCFSSSRIFTQQPIRIPTNKELLHAVEHLEESCASSVPTNDKVVALQNDATDSKSKTQPSPIDRLPQSPLTDPRLNAARFGHKTSKVLPRKEELTPFQLKLRRNPYANALGTSPRFCLLTGIRIPSYFLLQFGVTSHPETGVPWHLPTLAAKFAATEHEDAKAEQEELDVDQKGEAIQRDEQIQDSIASTSAPRTLSGSHLLSSHKTLGFISSLSEVRYRHLLPYRWKQESSIKREGLVWREDMANFTMELMRQKVVQGIVSLSDRLSAIYIVPCKDWDEVGLKPQVGSVLWLGRQRSDGDKEGADDIERAFEGEGPPPYAMVEYRGKRIPVYNLKTLLGQQHLHDIREKCPAIRDSSLVVLKGRNLSVDLQMWLWKLMGYLAQ